MRHSILYTLLLTLLSTSFIGCASETDPSYPKPIEDRRKDRGGKLTGDGLIVFGSDKKDTDSSVANGIGINSYLWRATLDTLSFMPLASADPFGGVIITEWYEEPSAPSERFKMNVLILDQRLRSNAIKLTAFRQVKQDGQWVDAPTTEGMATDLETKILTRARELRVKDR